MSTILVRQVEKATVSIRAPQPLVERCVAASTSPAGSFDQPAIRAWLGWQRYLAALDRCLDAALREFDLTRNQLTVLSTVGAEEGLTQQELAGSLGLTKASTSQMLTRLESAGLVERVPEARAYALRLTAPGRDVLDRALPAHHALILQHFGALSSSEQAHLAELTDKLNEAADEHLQARGGSAAASSNHGITCR